MSDHLVFKMGEFEAIFPTDRQYAKNHMWALPQKAGVYRFGFTAYAVRLLQDVYFLEWSVDAGVTLAERQEMGAIESKKAESALYSPMAGLLPRFNDDLLSDPSTINVDKYGDGWLFEIEGNGELLSPADYIKHLESVWEVTQRTIKGQLND
ncbi:MAG: glycine cleavage system protein H [Planctomycetaceae bacterium]|nr:glycine cleavage system protein H [Planctomycetaceae bacterium]